MARANSWGINIVRNADETYTATCLKDPTTAASGGTSKTPPAAEPMTNVAALNWCLKSVENIILNDESKEADE